MRALIFAALADGKSRINNLLMSDDAMCLISALSALGAKFVLSEDLVEVEGVNGKFRPAMDVLQVGNSGIALRFLTALASLLNTFVVITGDHSIRFQRPMQPLILALKQLGVWVETTKMDGFAPIIVKGPIAGTKVDVDGYDSQFVSALIIASAFAAQPVEISVQNAGETPWIDTTLSWLKFLNIKYEQTGYSYYKLLGSSSFCSFNYEVPADFGSAAFLIAAALVTKSEIVLRGLVLDSSQADNEVLSLFEQMGAKFAYNIATKELTVYKINQLSATNIDINNVIDALPIMAVLGCFADGQTVIFNGEVARTKECDRILCMATELTKMGANIEALPDGLIIKPAKLHASVLQSYDDHRVAMSLAVAALGVMKGESTILNFGCIGKTYPKFVSDLQRLGAAVR